MKKVGSSLQFLFGIEGFPAATVLIALYGFFTITAPDVFLKPRIYMSFLQTISPPLVLALGLTFVITAGEIDLSFPAVVAFSGFVFAWFWRTFDGEWALWVGFALAIAAGALVGYINGVLVALLNIPSIMATLASQFFWYGVTVLLAGGLSWALTDIRTQSIHGLFVGRLQHVVPDQNGTPVGLPVQALWALGLAIVLWFILNRHRFGEAVLFVGDNADVARVLGINVETTRIKLFTLMGVLSAFAGILLTLEINVFFPTQGEGFLLPVVAAVFIGGTSFAGGEGTVVGSFFGAFIIGSLEAGVVASGISGYWVQVIQGLVMASALALNVLVGENQLAAIASRMRHWSIPAGLNRSAPERADLDGRVL